jgi:hypothetical protein
MRAFAAGALELLASVLLMEPSHERQLHALMQTRIATDYLNKAYSVASSHTSSTERPRAALN